MSRGVEWWNILLLSESAVQVFPSLHHHLFCLPGADGTDWRDRWSLVASGDQVALRNTQLL